MNMVGFKHAYNEKMCPLLDNLKEKKEKEKKIIRSSLYNAKSLICQKHMRETVSRNFYFSFLFNKLTYSKNYLLIITCP